MVTYGGIHKVIYYRKSMLIKNYLCRCIKKIGKDQDPDHSVALLANFTATFLNLFGYIWSTFCIFIAPAYDDAPESQKKLKWSQLKV